MIPLKNKSGQAVQFVLGWLLAIFVIIFLFSGGFQSFYNISRFLASIPIWGWIVILVLGMLLFRGKR